MSFHHRSIFVPLLCAGMSLLHPWPSAAAEETPTDVLKKQMSEMQALMQKMQAESMADLVKQSMACPAPSPMELLPNAKPVMREFGRSVA